MSSIKSPAEIYAQVTVEHRELAKTEIREQITILAARFFYGFSTDSGAEFCLCMPICAEWNKSAYKKFRGNPGFNGGRGMD